MNKWFYKKPKKTRQPLGKRTLSEFSFWELVSALDREFSFFVRAGRAARQGHPYVSCITCGKTDHWKNMDFGHYFQREFFGVRWDVRNGGIQWRACNRFQEGRKAEMGLRLSESGVNLVELENLKDIWGLKHPDREYLIQQIQEFRKKNAEIKKAIKGQ
jgi:hypothetical protein